MVLGSPGEQEYEHASEHLTSIMVSMCMLAGEQEHASKNRTSVLVSKSSSISCGITCCRRWRRWRRKGDGGTNKGRDLRHSS